MKHFIHKARLVQAQVANRAAQGLTRFSYSPELNRIELLWRFCPHYWLTPDACHSVATPLQAVTQLIRDIGTHAY